MSNQGDIVNLDLKTSNLLIGVELWNKTNQIGNCAGRFLAKVALFPVNVVLTTISVALAILTSPLLLTSSINPTLYNKGKICKLSAKYNFLNILRSLYITNKMPEKFKPIDNSQRADVFYDKEGTKENNSSSLNAQGVIGHNKEDGNVSKITFNLVDGRYVRKASNSNTPKFNLEPSQLETSKLVVEIKSTGDDKTVAAPEETSKAKEIMNQIQTALNPTHNKKHDSQSDNNQQRLFLTTDTLKSLVYQLKETYCVDLLKKGKNLNTLTDENASEYLNISVNDLTINKIVDQL
jgi:hypothetical protein